MFSTTFRKLIKVFRKFFPKNANLEVKNVKMRFYALVFQKMDPFPSSTVLSEADHFPETDHFPDTDYFR